MRAEIIQGNVFDVLPTIKPGSVDCAVTSPPYWMLRSYLPKGHQNKHLELGSERTPAEYVANMVRVFSLVRDCLADHGTCWVNVGDTYLGSWGNSGKREGEQRPRTSKTIQRPAWDTFTERPANSRPENGQAGCMALIPQRLAIALADDGWLVRSIVVWHKPSCMPASLSGWSWRRCRVKGAKKNLKQTAKRLELGNGHERQSTFKARSVTGELGHEWSDCPGCKKCQPTGGYVLRKGSWRPTSSYEPVLMLAKSPRYFCDGESVKTPPAASTISRDTYTRILDDPDEQYAVAHDHETICDGANLRDVWTIASEPLRQKHYAAFPSELARRCLKAGTSARGYCPECGLPWVRVIESERSGESWINCKAENEIRNGPVGGGIGNNRLGPNIHDTSKTIGWRPSCSCEPQEPRPGLVLDPFTGSGRTAIVAGELGLDFVGAELNEEYVAMARKLTHERMPLFLEAP